MASGNAYIEEKRHSYKQVASISARGPQLLPHGDTNPLFHPTLFQNATPTGVPGIIRTGTALPLVHLHQASQFVMQSPTVPCLRVAHIYHLSTTPSRQAAPSSMPTHQITQQLRRHLL